MKTLKIPLFLVVILSLLATGCVTHMRSPGQETLDYAPVNADKRPGQVRYMSSGAGFIVNGRRQDAYRSMYRACSGKYEISNESRSSEGGFEYTYIDYRCVE